MITVFDVIAKLDRICPDYPGFIVIPFVILFGWYVLGGLFHGYNFIKEN
jgi:hypothetical protein